MSAGLTHAESYAVGDPEWNKLISQLEAVEIHQYCVVHYHHLEHLQFETQSPKKLDFDYFIPWSLISVFFHFYWENLKIVFEEFSS